MAKNFTLEKVVKEFPKILGYRFRSVDYKYLRSLWLLGKILEIFGLEINFFKNPENCKISMGDSGKIVEIIQEIRAKLTFVGRNL